MRRNPSGERYIRRSDWRSSANAGFNLRKHQRLKQLVPVGYVMRDGIAGEGMIKDLSLNGSYMTGNVMVSVGMAFALQIFVPGDPEVVLVDQATVKWVKGQSSA